MTTTYDVVTLGETMLRLTPPQLRRIEQAQSLEMHIGGSESNVAVGVSRLGLRTAWVSRLTANALGQTIVNQIRAQGVDTSHVVWTDHDRVGLYFYEEGRAPRGGRVIYDRAHSAMSQMQPDHLPDIFYAEQARLLHTSGITLAIGEAAADTARSAVQRAKDAGWLLSFDINYRALLWSPEEAATSCDAIAQLADILFLPLRDACTLYQTANNPQAALTALAERYPQACIVLTLGAEGAAASNDGQIAFQPAFSAKPVQRIGGGDAFVSGFLYSWLHHGDDVALALRWGTATAAHKYTLVGDMPLIDRQDIHFLVENKQNRSVLR